MASQGNESSDYTWSPSSSQTVASESLSAYKSLSSSQPLSQLKKEDFSNQGEQEYETEDSDEEDTYEDINSREEFLLVSLPSLQALFR
jgi:hypothetical protein